MAKRKSFRYAGTKFASDAERKFAQKMDKDGVPWLYEPERFPWVPPKRTYTPDFKVQRKDGSYFYIEYKGYLKPRDRTKMKQIKEQYPNLDIRFIFMRANNKLNRSTKTTYGEWADRLGYQWAEKEIPEEWLEEAA